MPLFRRDRPAKKLKHRGNVDKEFDSVYQHLAKADWGPFRLFYCPINEAIYIQVKTTRDALTYSSVLKIDRNGNLSTTGTHTPSTTLENPGRG